MFHSELKHVLSSYFLGYEVLCLKYGCTGDTIEGMRMKDIATKLNLSEQKVKYAHSKALSILQKYFQMKGINFSDLME